MMQFICAPQPELSPKKDSLKKEHLGINIDHLVSLSQEESYKMPEGLTREQRRLWAKKMLNTK